MERLVVIGDSLSMPRLDDGIEYEATYPFILQREGYEVVCRSRRANDTNIQTLRQNILDDLICFKPKTIVVHLGIVDCAPRIFSRSFRSALSILPSLIRKPIIAFCSFHRYRVTKFFPIVYVKPNEYKSNLIKLINVAYSLKSKVILINIKKTNLNNTQKSYRFAENICHYNSILREIALEFKLSLIDVNKIEGGLLSDGIHIDRLMHLFIADEIKNTLTS